MKEEEIKVERNSFLVSGDKIFFTLQGEGQSLGKPAIFLRLHLCNLHCSWCDTKYTWDKTDPRFTQEPERWGFEDTFKKISQFPCKRLIITGGEPMLHTQAIDEFITPLLNWDIEIETNGTIIPTQRMVDRKVQFNVSPKLENSGNELPLRYRKPVLEAYNKLDNTTFKFVVTSTKDIEEITHIIEDCNLDNNKIILMPEGVTMEAISEHGKEVADLCKEKGWRLVPRLQILLWGKRRAI